MRSNYSVRSREIGGEVPGRKPGRLSGPSEGVPARATAGSVTISYCMKWSKDVISFHSMWPACSVPI